MKKCMVCLLALLLLTACGASAGECTVVPPVTLTEPPALTVTAESGDATEAIVGGWSWEWDGEDGERCYSVADAAHPLDCQALMTPLTVCGETVTVSSEAEDPDSISVRCWSADDWGSPGTAQEESIETDGLAFALKEGDWVYQIVATWSSPTSWGGTAYYCFCTEVEDRGQTEGSYETEEETVSVDGALTADVTYGDAVLSVTLPDDWSCSVTEAEEAAAMDGLFLCAIEFYATAEPEVCLSLELWGASFGICGTGVDYEQKTLSDGVTADIYTEGQNDSVWIAVCLSCDDWPLEEGMAVVAQGHLSRSQWTAWREDIFSILDTVAVTYG